MHTKICETIPIHSDGGISEDGALLEATTLLAGSPDFRVGVQDQPPSAACPKVVEEATV